MAYESDLVKDLKLSRRKPLNLVCNLIGRELGTYSTILFMTSTRRESANKRQLTRLNHLKRIYLCVTPNYSVLNVKIPNCYLRRFSPDGRHLVSFTGSLDGVQIFFFKSSSAGIESIRQFNSVNSASCEQKSCLSDKTNYDNYESYTFRMRAFDVYFQQSSTLKLTENNELMNRECALFYRNSYLIVASSELVSDDNLPPYSQLATNNESIHCGLIENYTIYLVDTRTGKLCDKIKFKADKLNLTHNQSFGLFNDIFTVLSLQNQTIHVYNLVLNDETGCKFVHKQSIGRFCFEDDEQLIQSQARANLIHNRTRLNSSQMRAPQNTAPEVKGFTETCLTSMKQRVISFLYREAHENNTLSEFYLTVNSLINLKIEKLQLLDEAHLFIKYVSVEYMNSGSSKLMANQTTSTVSSSSLNNNSGQQQYTQSSGSNQRQATLNETTSPFYFVLYNMNTATVLNATRNSSSKLLNVLENFHDYFSLTVLDGSYSCSRFDSMFFGNSFNFHTLPSNNSYSRTALQRHLQSVSKFNSGNELTKCLLSQLPISPQTFTATPYLDHSLFSYDEKLISNVERAKAIGDQIIKFNLRDSGRSCFKLYAGRQNNQPASQYQPMKRLVTFIWHPTQPFCISIQRNSQEYNVNFHVYSKIALE